MSGVPSVVVPSLGATRLERLLTSLAGQTVEHQTIVVDNGSRDGEVADLCRRFAGVEVLRLEANAGYSRACNLGAARADGDVLVLLNDDCVCDPDFLEQIAAPIDPVDGVAMVAAVMRDWADPERIDSAGMELDHTLLVFDYLNGEPLSRLEGPVRDPIGPSGAAAAFDRATFLALGGFDERLFAYWEDVDLVLRLRRLGFRCRLAARARGVHEHSASLGSGSRRKNYLMGFGRGYVLRKWGVLGGGRLPAVLAREAVLCAGQGILDRNLAGVRGRIDGYRAASASERYPAGIERASEAPGALENLRRRAQRRARLRSRPREAGDPARPGLRALACFHLAETTGPSRSLASELAWLGERGPLKVIVPGRDTGAVGELFQGAAEVAALDYSALTLPAPGLLGLARAGRELRREVRLFRAVIRAERPDLVLAVTTRLPAVSLAAWLEGLPLLVYCGELYGRVGGSRILGLLGAGLVRLIGAIADVVIACSQTVARQFEGCSAEVVTVYPPVGRDYACGDGVALRERFGIPAGAPLVASVGYITEGRGQDVLIRAMPRLLERAPEARCLLVGAPFPRPQDVAFRDRLETLAAELGVAEAVTFAGHVEQVADVFAASDVIVNPIRFEESFGRVAFEAGVAGTPAVVTRVGAVPELIADRESALIVEPEDPRALADAVARLFEEPALARRLAAGAAEVVNERLLPEHSLEGFSRAVAAALAARPGRRGGAARGPGAPRAPRRAAPARARRHGEEPASRRPAARD